MSVKVSDVDGARPGSLRRRKFCLWLLDYSLTIEGNFIAATNDTVHERVFPIATRRCIKRRVVGYTSDGVAFRCVEICRMRVGKSQIFTDSCVERWNSSSTPTRRGDT